MTGCLPMGIRLSLPTAPARRAVGFFFRAFGAAPIREAQAADSHCVGGSAWVLPRGRFFNT